MSDTQWPRYEVFKQDSPRKPHVAVGSVHAPDAEMALLNARDVFARRPSAVSMWVVPADAILKVTAEEMATNPNWDEETAVFPQTRQSFHIFNKQSQRRAMTYVKHRGQVVAATAGAALQQALAQEKYAVGQVFVWWVVPERAITRSEAADVASLFAPAATKTYRQQSRYGFVGVRRKNRRGETDHE